MEDEAKIREILSEHTGRLTAIEANIGALGVSVNSVVETVNNFLTSAHQMMTGGGLSALMGALGKRNDG